jgi:hypothetical protein
MCDTWQNYVSQLVGLQEIITTICFAVAEILVRPPPPPPPPPHTPPSRKIDDFSEILT